MKLKVIFVTLFISAISLAQTGISSEDILVMNDSIQLPGTLTYNSELKSQPLVIFVHGSGKIDRNGNQAMINPNANYIKVLSDSLVKRDIAFFRYDKRTSNQANLKFIMSDISFDGFVEDINTLLELFKKDKRFSSITLIGHSQGSLVAMLANQTLFDKYVSLAGASEVVDKTIVRQVKQQNGDSIAAIVKSHFKELRAKGTIENVDPNLMILFNKPTQPFFASWMKYDPAEDIKNVKLPILILNGTKDLQISVSDAETLYQANPKATLEIIDKMNHVLKNIENDEDNFKSYNSADVPLSEKLVSVLEKFIKQ